MKKLISGLLMALTMTSGAFAKESITVVSYSGPGGSLMPFLRAIVEKANSMQDKYSFEVVNKPGAGGLLALQAADQSPQNTLALVSAGFADHVAKGKIDAKNYVPVSSMGDTCWILLSNRGDAKVGATSLKGEKRLTVGSVAHGSSVHLSALVLGDKLGFEVQNVVFKSHLDGLVVMAGDGSINLMIDTPQNYETFRTKNPAIKPLGTNCDQVNPRVPGAKPLSAQGFKVPGIWTVITAHRDMPAAKQASVQKALDDAIRAIGQKEIFEKYNYSVPVLNGQTAAANFEKNLQIVNETRSKFADVINKK